MRTAAFLAVLGAVPIFATNCTAPVQRKNWTSLTPAEKTTYLEAVQCLFSTPASHFIHPLAQTLWDEQQLNHILQSNFIHNVGQFLPWHRYFLNLHESLLHTYCDYPAESGVPYWDEEADADNITASALWDTEIGFGGNGDANTTCVVDGPFANTILHIGGETLNQVIPKEATYCLNRTFSEHDFEKANSSTVENCFAYDGYYDFLECMNAGMHFAGHAGTGGTMINTVLSPGDPVFFLHHANLDRLWWKWQSANSTARLYAIGGSNIPSFGPPVLPPGVSPPVSDVPPGVGFTMPGKNFTDYDGDKGNVTTLNHVLWMTGMLRNATAREVMDIRGETVCAEYV